MRIVIKIGTSTLAHPSGQLNIRCFEELTKIISDIQNAGHEVVIVSSGSIGIGAGKLHIVRPKDMPGKQAAAAVGQCELMSLYDYAFSRFNHMVAQILLTREDFDQADRLENLQNTLYRLLSMKVIPIINENDTVATHEIAVGDNDTMSALVARAIEADLLILLSDIDGLYTADPHLNPNAKLIPVVEKLSQKILALGGGSGSELGTGGMCTKLSAAQIVMEAGTDMLIINGEDPEKLYDVLDGKAVGTRFIGRKDKA